MSAEFGPQVLGQTEKALNAILDRELAGPGLTEPQWVTLRLAVMLGGAVEGELLVGRVADALKVGEPQARARVEELATARLVEGRGSSVAVTDRGRRVHGEIRGAVAEITGRLWGDLPSEDLVVAGRVLATILERANGELAGA